MLKEKRKRGRPIKDQETFRGCRLFVKLTATERLIVESIAGISAVTLSDFVRIAIAKEAQRGFRRVKKELGAILDESAPPA